MSKPEIVEGVEISVDALKRSGAVPAWFGLGFIQMKLDDTRRIHFWHPELMADVPEEELHDHRYQFTSRILRGSLINETWEFLPNRGGDIVLVEVSCEPDNPREPVSLARGIIRRTGSYTLPAGSHYTLEPNAFHRIIAKEAVTFLTRGPKVKQFANVLRPNGIPHICPFARKIPEAKLWDYIGDLLSLERPH